VYTIPSHVIDAGSGASSSGAAASKGLPCSKPAILSSNFARSNIDIQYPHTVIAYTEQVSKSPTSRAFYDLSQQPVQANIILLIRGWQTLGGPGSVVHASERDASGGE
jgi:hypothetical protein